MLERKHRLRVGEDGKTVKTYLARCIAALQTTRRKSSSAGNTPLAVKQAASCLGVSSEKLYRLVSEGAIRHYRVGRTIRFTPEHLDAYRQEMTQAARCRTRDNKRPDRL